MSSSSQIRRGAILSYASVGFNALAGLLYTPWMVATIGNDNYGLYTLAMSVINIFVMDFGLGDAVSRYLSKYYAENDYSGANQFVSLILRLYFCISIILTAVLLVVYLNIDTLYARLGLDQLVIFKRLFVIVGLYSVVSFPCTSLNGMLTARELFVKLNGCNFAQRVFTVGLIVVALLMGYGVYALVVVNAVVGLFFHSIKLLFVVRDTPIRAGFDCGNLRIREVLGFSLWTTVAQLAQRCIFTLMPSIIAIVSSSEQIAVFGLASSLEGYVWSVANALNGMFMPKVTRVLNQKESVKAMQTLAIRVGRIQLHITGAIIVVFAAIGQSFIDCWVGSGFSSLYVCTLLLILPEIIELPTMIEGTAIIAAGKVREKGIVYVIMALTNLLLGYCLSGLFGAVGACISICAAYFVRTFGMCFLYCRFLAFNPVVFLRKTYSGWLIVALLTFMVGEAIHVVQLPSGWIGFGLRMLIVVSAYVVSCWGFAMDKSEKDQVRSLLSIRA